MADRTLIAWTDHTANFWMGCQKVSDGCKNCYAETLTTNRMGLKVWGPPKTTTRQPVKSVYANLRKWNADQSPGVRGAGEPHLVFVGSLMDWAEDHPVLDAVRVKMWEAIRANDRLHYQMLTKRPERIPELLPTFWDEIKHRIWLGTSVEDERVQWRVDHLRGLDSAVRFISYEPALGPLDTVDLTGIDWLIYGGESGPGWRKEGEPNDPHAWARRIRMRCEAFGTHFFFKQSAAPRTEMGITLDGQVVRRFPLRVLAGGGA